jgi:hypothetical protein
MRPNRSVALLVAAATLAVPPLAWAGAEPTPPAVATTDPAPSTDPAPTTGAGAVPAVTATPRLASLAAEPPPPTSGPTDPLAWALREDVALAEKAHTGFGLRRTGALLVAGGYVALPVGLTVWLIGIMEGLGTGQRSSTADVGAVISGAALLAMAGGGICIATGSAERMEAAAQWNARHPERPVQP